MENSIKSIRLSTELSRVEFAEKYHINIRTLIQWEQGVRTPPEYVYYLLKRAVEQDFMGIVNG